MGDSRIGGYEIPDEDLLKWSKGGRAFQDMLKALQTSQRTSLSPGELLSRTHAQSWHEITRELNITPFT